MEDLTDEALLQQLCNSEIKQQQDDLITQLYLRYNETMLSWLLLKTKDINKAQELASEVIEKLLKALRKMAGSHQENTIQNFKSWLYRISHNAFIDDFQKNKKLGNQIFLSEKVGNQERIRLIDENPELVQVKLNFEYKHLMQELAIFLLSESQQEVYLTRYYKQTEKGKRLQVKDVAEVLNTTTRVIWTNLKTGKERLEKLIGNAYEVGVNVEITEEVYIKLLTWLELEVPVAQEEKVQEIASCEPAFRLLPLAQSKLVLDFLLKEKKIKKSENSILKKAKENLTKMLEGRRNLDVL